MTGLRRHLALILAAAAVLSGVATVALMTEAGPFAADPNPRTVIVLLYLDLVLVLALGAVLARRLVRLWVERRRGAAGSRLHVRLVALFTTMALVPTIMVTVFSVLFFHLGLQAWFSDTVRTAVEESVAVARAYLAEHRQAVAGDVRAMAADLDRVGPALLARDPRQFGQFVADQAAVRGLTEAIVFAGDGRVVARAGYTFSLAFEQIPGWALAMAEGGEVAILAGTSDDRVRALVRLNSLPNTFLFVGRFVDEAVLQHIESTQGAVQAYRDLEGRRASIEVTFSLIFGLVALLMLMAAVWMGLIVTTRLTAPIMRLIDAAGRVREGDLAVRLPAVPAGDELGTLTRAFNRMTSQLASQRQALETTNHVLDERRRFMEAVLEGVTAGVMGLDRDGRITLVNQSATWILEVEADRLLGTTLGTWLPEGAVLVEKMQQRPERPVQAQVRFQRRSGPRTLLLQITAECMGFELVGLVATFDDITELLSAQRTAAWADVARRIAHEIKNPLTPIQLSAERLRRRYLKQVTDDPATFDLCVDTITRQVSDIRDMVDEFSAFARMPTPDIQRHDLVPVVRDAVFLEQASAGETTLDLDLPPGQQVVACDQRQTRQALINIIKNALEAVAGRREREGEAAPPGRVRVTLSASEEAVTLAVIDNGCGLPEEERDRLTEPYVTTRARGTGLGLAIVNKIMEDHQGDLILEDRDDGEQGTQVRLRFPRGGEDEPGP